MSYNNDDKTFYRHPDSVQPFGFVLLFFDAGGFADLINGALLLAHEFSLTFQLFREPACLAIVFFGLSLQTRKNGTKRGRGNPDLRASISLTTQYRQCLRTKNLANARPRACL